MGYGDNTTQVITLDQTTALTLTAMSVGASSLWSFYRGYGKVYYWK